MEITTWATKSTLGIDLAKALAKLSSCLQDLWWLILLIVALVACVAYMLSFWRITYKVTNNTISELKKNKKYIPKVFVELNEGKEVLRYFVFGNKWRKRIIKAFNFIYHNSYGDIKDYCGAVAVSWYSRLINGAESNTATIEAVKRLVGEGCTTNIHYVISNQTIREAIYRLENDLFPRGINAVIFILYKPVGYGQRNKMVSQIELLEKFLMLAIKKHNFRVGFDTCFTPAILRWCMDDIPVSCIDACEAGTFSMYIDSQLNAYPCSFGIDCRGNGISLKSNTIRDVWSSELFSQLRKSADGSCLSCKEKVYCLGGCKLRLDINLCKEQIRV